MILGVREMVSSATISSSSIILRKEGNGGYDRWGVALRRKLKIVYTPGLVAVSVCPWNPGILGWNPPSSSDEGGRSELRLGLSRRPRVEVVIERYWPRCRNSATRWHFDASIAITVYFCQGHSLCRLSPQFSRSSLNTHFLCHIGI